MLSTRQYVKPHSCCWVEVLGGGINLLLGGFYGDGKGEGVEERGPDVALPSRVSVWEHKHR